MKPLVDFDYSSLYPGVVKKFKITNTVRLSKIRKILDKIKHDTSTN